MKIDNITNIFEKNVQKDDFGLTTKMLSAQVGCEKIHVNIDYIQPKTYSTKYHSHSQQEEFFLVLEGTGELRFNSETMIINKGDFFSKKAGENNAHSIYNSSDDRLIILDIATIEKEDTCYYPDENIYLHKVGNDRKVYSGENFIENWSSDPNKK